MVLINSDNYAPVSSFASDIFTHLCIGVYNPPGNYPQLGDPDSLGSQEWTSSIKDLLAQIKHAPLLEDKQRALRAIVFRRANLMCPITDLPFAPPDDRKMGYPQGRYIHIIPVAVRNKPRTIREIEQFMGIQLTQQIIDRSMHPANAIALSHDAQDLFDSLMWSIEAQVVDNGTQYIFRSDYPGALSPTVKRKSGYALNFGPFRNEDADPDEDIRPDPVLCNIHHSIHKVLHMSGAAEVIYEMADDDDYEEYNVGLGVSELGDSIFLDRLGEQLGGDASLVGRS